MGPPSAPGPLNLWPQAPPPCPCPTPPPDGGLHPVSGPHLHVSLALHPRGLPAPAPPPPLLWPQCPGHLLGSRRGPCLPGTLGGTHLLGNPACLTENLENMRVTCTLSPSKYACYCYNSNIFPHICVFPFRYIEMYKFELLYTPCYMLAQLNFMF